jgi:hypothetical protein
LKAFKDTEAKFENFTYRAGVLLQCNTLGREVNVRLGIGNVGNFLDPNCEGGNTGLQFLLNSLGSEPNCGYPVRAASRPVGRPQAGHWHVVSQFRFRSSK